MVVLDEVAAERLDERRLARAGRAGDPDAHRAADVREHLGEQRLGLGAVVGARRLDQRDRARERAPVTVDHLARQLAHAAGEGTGRRQVRREEAHDLGGRLRDVGARAEDRGDARLAQLVVVLRGDHAAGHDEDVVATLLAQLGDELGDQRLVAGGLARHADEVHVVLDRVACRLLGRLEERADVDVEAEVGERGGDHLGAAVVAVLTELGDEQARAAARALGRELLDRGAHLVVALVALVRRAVHAGDATDRGAVAREHLFERVGDLADGRPGPGRLDRQLEQVAVAARAFAQAVERLAARGLVAVGPQLSRGGRAAARARSALSTSRMSTWSSSARRYLLTPTMTSSPRSIAACLRAAASSMRSFGMPDSTALVMPPSASTSSISFHASSARLAVSAST